MPLFGTVHAGPFTRSRLGVLRRCRNATSWLTCDCRVGALELLAGPGAGRQPERGGARRVAAGNVEQHKKGDVRAAGHELPN